MHRRFIALIVGTALAVTGLTANRIQAQVRGDAATTITDVAALAIIGTNIADDRTRK